MLAAYTDLDSAQCAKCHKPLDAKKFLLPAGRRRNVISDMSDLKSDWQAYHEQCLP